MKNNVLNILTSSFAIVLMLLMTACESDYTPKPRGYFRIDMPEKEYVLFDNDYPYSFEYPAYASVIEHPGPEGEQYWIDMVYPKYNGQLHISYKKVEGNLLEYLEDSRTFVIKHIPKATAINDSLVEDRDRRLFGLVYDIEGQAAASPCQFILTDSAQHFVRGALYFNTQPNNDSLAPVIERMREDIWHLIDSFEWQD